MFKYVIRLIIFRVGPCLEWGEEYQFILERKITGVLKVLVSSQPKTMIGIYVLFLCYLYPGVSSSSLYDHLFK